MASQSPKELSRLIDQISGSLELAGEYEKAKDAQERATENATFNFNKRRGIAGEIKQYKEQKGEAERFESLCQEKASIWSLPSSPFITNHRLDASHRTSWFSVACLSSCFTFRNHCPRMRKISRSRTLPSPTCAMNNVPMRLSSRRHDKIKRRLVRPLCQRRNASKEQKRRWRRRYEADQAARSCEVR